MTAELSDVTIFNEFVAILGPTSVVDDLMCGYQGVRDFLHCLTGKNTEPGQTKISPICSFTTRGIRGERQHFVIALVPQDARITEATELSPDPVLLGLYDLACPEHWMRQDLPEIASALPPDQSPFLAYDNRYIVNNGDYIIGSMDSDDFKETLYRCQQSWPRQLYHFVRDFNDAWRTVLKRGLQFEAFRLPQKVVADGFRWAYAPVYSIKKARRPICVDHAEPKNDCSKSESSADDDDDDAYDFVDLIGGNSETPNSEDDSESEDEEEEKKKLIKKKDKSSPNGDTFRQITAKMPKRTVPSLLQKKKTADPIELPPAHKRAKLDDV